jgi:transposase
MSNIAGIDVAKATLAVTLITDADKALQKSCANTPAGHADLVRWLARHAPGPVRVGLEATGGYQDAAAVALHDAGHHVSVLNPAAVAAYGQSQLRRAKTDATDAWLIADYVRTQTPPRWIPPPPDARQLQALVRRLDALLEMQTQESNRLELAAAIVRPSIEATLAHLAEEIVAIKRQIAAHIDQFPTLRSQRDLIVSIPGIGDTTAAIVLGELLDIARFTSARQLAAFAGLVPLVRQSGTSVRGRGALSSWAPAASARRCTFRRSPPCGTIRRCLAWPAASAPLANPRW